MVWFAFRLIKAFVPEFLYYFKFYFYLLIFLIIIYGNGFCENFFIFVVVQTS